jgi:hypothetical protein
VALPETGGKAPVHSLVAAATFVMKPSQAASMIAGFVLVDSFSFALIPMK